MLTYIEGMLERRLGQQMTKALMFDMDDARRDKFKRVSTKVIDLLRREMENPAEGYLLLQFVRESMEECYGIEDKEAHS